MPRKARRQSVRSYRRLIDEQMELARKGKISWSDATAAATAAKAAAEMLMTENLMRSEGMVDREVSDHVLGEDGGANYQPNRRPTTYVNKKVTVKRGVNSKGENVDETTVVMDGLNTEPDEENNGESTNATE